MSFPKNKTDDFAWDVKSNTNSGVIKFDKPPFDIERNEFLRVTFNLKVE